MKPGNWKKDRQRALAIATGTKRAAKKVAAKKADNPKPAAKKAK